jgi:uncharacterized protein (TIGR00645 family)
MGVTMQKTFIERWLEGGLFASRWLVAPFYLGLVLALGALLVVFVQELIHELPHVVGMTPESAILLALTLIDISLAGNLVLIVIFSGYENFVSKINIGDHEDRPEWMGTVDFSGLKLKLIASIVAISGIALLKAFLSLTDPTRPLDQPRLTWLVVIHLTFVVSGVLLSSMDWVTSRTKKH